MRKSNKVSTVLDIGEAVVVLGRCGVLVVVVVVVVVVAVDMVRHKQCFRLQLRRFSVDFYTFYTAVETGINTLHVCDHFRLYTHCTEF